MERFFAIDVETANPSMSSICQIGLVGFENGKEVRSESWLVNPQDWFDPINVSIHGITDDEVRGAAHFADLHQRLCEIIDNEIVVCHTHFDRVAVHQTAQRWSKQVPACHWLDSARVARRTWSQFAQSGYGLANLADHCGIQFRHHDANQDARTAGLILLQAIEESGIGLEDWLTKSRRTRSGSTPIRRSGDGNGALVGEVVVFTGALLVPRRLAADKAAEAGADVQPSVTKETTMLVVGDQDVARLGGKDKSSKHIKAERLVTKGQAIRILGETDFMALSSITE